MKNSKVSLQEKTKALANEALNCLQSCDKVSRTMGTNDQETHKRV